MAADDAKGAGEGDPVGIVPGVEGGLVLQVPQRVVGQQGREGLLFDAAWVLGTQHQPRDALVVLDLVQGVPISHRWAQRAASSWAGACSGPRRW